MFDSLSSTKCEFTRRGKRSAAGFTAALTAAFLLLAAGSAMAQGAGPGGASPRLERRPEARPGTVVIPQVSRMSPGDAGIRSHANVRFILPELASPSEAPPFSGYGYETPASLACLYHVVTPIAGCNPNDTTNTPSGGSRTIVIVDAYDDPNAAADLAAFSAQFGLSFSPKKFHVVYAGGSAPPVDPTGGWELEESLDIEYAHAMAPDANLYLVEANSNYDSDLYPAVQVASNLIACGQTTACPPGSHGRGEVSMSWSGGEFPQEVSLDSYFATPGVVYFAASGDSAGVGYPCASPNVVCVGGTSAARNEYTGDLIREIAWSDAGGGVSYYEPIPGYQSSNPAIVSLVGAYRGVPDISADSNPSNGAWVVDTNPYFGSVYTWWVVGGTSLATPLVAGVVNASGHFASSSAAELSSLYSASGRLGVNDITYGACGYYSGSFSGAGWDLCTGLGSPKILSER